MNSVCVYVYYISTCIYIYYYVGYSSRIMGQTHSHSKDKTHHKGRHGSTNYGLKSHGSDSMSSSSKSKKQRNSTKETKNRSSHPPLPSPPTLAISSTSGGDYNLPNRTSSYSHPSSYQGRLPYDTSGMMLRSSYSGGERSAPARQFSLTRPSTSNGGVSGGGSQNKHAQIEKYFNKYKDHGEDAILAEGMEKFCVDLGLDPTEFTVLVIAWKFEASQMCRFTREEFVNGCQKMRAHDAKSLKERFPELLEEARETKNFKELYNFTFSFGLDHGTGQRSLPADMAIPLWDLVFSQERPELLDRWFSFLQSREVRGISRDTWNMFLPFVQSIKPDLSNYDESEAWPSLFDDFVEAELEKQ